MSSTIYIEVANKDEVAKAVEFLKESPMNQNLRNVDYRINIIGEADLEWAKKENVNLISWAEENQGKCNLDVDVFENEKAEEAGFEISDICEMQTQVLEGLNKCVTMEYHAYSSGFEINEHSSFTLAQIKRITQNGKLLTHTDEYRVLLAQLLEPEKDTISQIASPKMSTKKLLQKVKENNEDKEWYPTTREIIEAIYWDIKKGDFEEWRDTGMHHKNSSISLLDIGAGNGKVFNTIKEISQEQPEDEYKHLFIKSAYAIEQSQTLIETYDEDIFVVGTQFYEQTLIDKKTDVIFSNPPYSDFENWSTKVIKEANAEVVYLVIPDRWEKSLDIARAIELRKAIVETIGHYDFLNSEDRAARAKVSLVKITLIKKTRYKDEGTDPFDIWFNEVFQSQADKSKDTGSDFFKNKSKSERIKNLVKGQTLIPRLEELYNEEMQYLMNTYKSVSELDRDLLKELNVSQAGLIEALKMKIQGLKHLYWQELFDNLDTITSKLTSSSRSTLLRTLTANTNVDFTISNAYAVVVWAIKNANKYYDSQLLSIYYSFSNSKNIQNYKSNKKLVEDGWRYESNNSRFKHHSHYALDYRIVVGDYWSEVFDFEYGTTNVRGLKDNAATAIHDLFIIARNLGFNVARFYHEESGKMIPLSLWQIRDRDWQPGKNQYFNMQVPSSKEEGTMVEENFVEIKAFKNGNMHYRFSQKFMKALNLEAARLNMWVKSPKEASQEFDITEEEASELFNSNFKVIHSQMTTLLTQSIEPEELASADDTDTIEAKQIVTESVEDDSDNKLFLNATRDEKMIIEISTKLLSHHKSGDLYGGIKSLVPSSNKEKYLTQTVGAYQTFEMCDDYRAGKLTGKTVIYKRDKENNLSELKINTVKFDGKIPFQPTEKSINIQYEEIKDALYSEDLLSIFERITSLITSKKEDKRILVVKPDFSFVKEKSNNDEAVNKQQYKEDDLKTFANGSLF